MRTIGRAAQRDAVALSALLVLASAASLLAFRHLIPRFASAIGPTLGDPLFTLTIFEWISRQLRDGIAGFWSPPFFHPATNALTLSDHMMLPGALYAGLRGLGATPALAHNLLLVSSFPLTAAACYLLLRRATRVSRWIAVGLALAIVCAPWRWGQLPHLMMIWAPGPPLALWTFDRLLSRPSRGRAAAFVLAEALTLLSGSYLAYLTQLALAILFVAHLSRGRDRRRWVADRRALGLLALAASGAIALALAIHRPYFQAREDPDLHRNPQEIVKFGARAADWLQPSASSVYGGLLPERPWKPERELFPGVLLSLGAAGGAAALLAKRFGRRGEEASRSRHVLPLPILGRALLWVGLAFVVMSQTQVFLALSRLLPGMDGMRVPTRGQLFVLCGTAVLTAIGFAAVRGERARTVASLAVAALLCLDAIPRPVDVAMFEPVETRESVPGHVLALSSLAPTAVAVFPLLGTAHESTRMWRLHIHGQRIVNGYSGFVPASFRWLRAECRTAQNRILDRCLSALAAAGVSHFVVEDAHYAAPGATIEARIDAAIGGKARDRVRLVASDLDALVFERIGAELLPAKHEEE